MKSEAIAISNPPPKAMPLTAEITGLLQFSGAASTSSAVFMNLRTVSGSN